MKCMLNIHLKMAAVRIRRSKRAVGKEPQFEVDAISSGCPWRFWLDHSGQTGGFKLIQAFEDLQYFFKIELSISWYYYDDRLFDPFIFEQLPYVPSSLVPAVRWVRCHPPLESIPSWSGHMVPAWVWWTPQYVDHIGHICEADSSKCRAEDAPSGWRTPPSIPVLRAPPQSTLIRLHMILWPFVTYESGIPFPFSPVDPHGQSELPWLQQPLTVNMLRFR